MARSYIAAPSRALGSLECIARRFAGGYTVCRIKKTGYSVADMVVRMRRNRSQTAKRRSHHALKGARLATCVCGAPRMPHRTCASCGKYNGRVAVDVVALAERMARRTKRKEKELRESGRLSEYAKELGARDSDLPFMKLLLTTAMTKQSEIDEVIVRAAPEWPLEKISAIDRNILRLGLTELLYADRAQVPAKVAINEAI